MTQIHNIVAALNAVAMQDPMAAAIVKAGGLPGGIHQGTDASRNAIRPFALITATRISGEHNSSGVSLATYQIDLQIVVDEDANVAGEILGAFHRYWDRLADLDLDTDEATFVMIHAGGSEQGEEDQQSLAQEHSGADIMLGVTGWTLWLSEHQPALET